MLFIPSWSDFLDARTTVTGFQPIKIKSKGRGVPSICLLIPAEVMAPLAEELITDDRKTWHFLTNAIPSTKMPSKSKTSGLESGELLGSAVS